MPEFEFADFVPELVPAISEYNGILVGMPYDIPIFTFAYRKDVLEQLKLKVPTTMPEFLATAKAIFEAKLTNKDGSPIYGYVGQWKSGHYALQCDWTSWLWSHGGSHTGKGNSVVINDANGLAGAQYMMELAKYTDPGSTTYDWSGQGDAMAAGSAGLIIDWCEFFPGWDGEKSKVPGLIEPADLPKEDSLRSPKDCSFGEIPAIGHQGGSCLAISKYSKIPDAAFVFLQWATCKETIALAAAQSNTPVRLSTFSDPRILAKAKPVPGTTRHFPAALKVMQTRMGTEPHFPGWADVSSTGAVIPTELGKMTAGGQDPKTTLDNIAAAIDKAIKS
jgi:multiple sugar transport system substrate-binding protein